MSKFKQADSKELESLKNELYQRQRQQQDLCDHKSAKGPTIQRYKEKGTLNRNTGGWSDNAKVCTRCRTVFETTIYTPSQLQDGMRMLYSMIDQIKLLADLNDEEVEQVLSALESLRTIEAITTFYNEMMKRISKEKGKDNRKRNIRGGFGVSQNMFNQGSRRYN